VQLPGRTQARAIQRCAPARRLRRGAKAGPRCLCSFPSALVTNPVPSRGTLLTSTGFCRAQKETGPASSPRRINPPFCGKSPPPSRGPLRSATLTSCGCRPQARRGAAARLGPATSAFAPATLALALVGSAFAPASSSPVLPRHKGAEKLPLRASLYLRCLPCVYRRRGDEGKLASAQLLASAPKANLPFGDKTHP